MSTWKEKQAQEIERQRTIRTRQTERRNGIMFIALVAVVAIVWIVTPSCPSTPKPQVIEKPAYTAYDAYSNMQTFVNKQIKAPLEAKYAPMTDATITQSTDSTFEIISYVDAQNDFGVFKRGEFTCLITFTHNNKVRCDYFAWRTQ